MFITAIRDRLIRLLGGWIEGETQVTQPDGSWITWTSGFLSRADAAESLREDRASNKRGSSAKWRLQRRTVWTRYFY